jgi:hypothetical protein
VLILLAIVLRGLWPRFQPRAIVLPLLAFIGSTLLWLVPLGVAIGGNLLLLGGFVGATNVAGLFAPPEPTLLVPLACLAGGLLLLRQTAGPVKTQIGWLLLAGTCLFGTQYPRLDTLHLAWSAPLLLVVGAAVLSRLPWPWVLLSLAAVAVLAVPTLVDRTVPLRVQRVPSVQNLEVPVATAADLQGVLAEIDERTAPDEPIFVYPSSPLLYTLAGRPNPTRFDHLYPGAASPAQIDGVIADLDRSAVRLVVISDFWRQVWGQPGPNAPLEAWLGAHFQPVARAGSYEILARL